MKNYFEDQVRHLSSNYIAVDSLQYLTQMQLRIVQ